MPRFFQPSSPLTLLKIWDLRTGATSETIKYDGPVTALQFDSRKVVAAAGENGVKVRISFLVITHNQLKSTYFFQIFNRTSSTQSSLITNGHTGPGERLRYMDRYLVSGGRDTAVKIWAIQKLINNRGDTTHNLLSALPYCKYIIVRKLYQWCKIEKYNNK